MNNLMDEYIEFTKKNLRKYMKIIFEKYYDNIVIDEYIKTYINARYYNITHSKVVSRAFFKRILNELEYKKEILERKLQKEEIKADERIIENAEKVFEYILFFDNVRKVDNFKTINSIKEVVKNLTILRNEKFKIKTKDDFEDKLYKQIVDDMLAKEIYLEKFEDDKFYLEMQNAKENIYYVTLLNNIKVSENYSERAKDKAFSSKIVAEDKIKIEYILLSIISLKDILSGNFDDIYISRFECSLFKKEKKLESTLNLIDNQALKEKINLNITYEEYVTYNKKINELIGQGYKFCITLDNTFKDIEKLENLKIFNIVILPKEIRQYNEISRKKKIYKNIIEK